jgi:putative membrane protein
MMFSYDHNMGWWGWAGMGVGMVLFWALLIAGIVALIAYINGDRQDRQVPSAPISTASPEQVLAARFAHGEINETEYRDRLAVLRDHAHS